MNFYDFYNKTDETAQYSDGWMPYLALGLAGEAGEAADVVKKSVRYWKMGDPYSLVTNKDRTHDFKLEMGDVQWYWSQLVRKLKLDPEEIFQMNYDKLTKRYG